MKTDDIRSDLVAWLDGELTLDRARLVREAVERDPDLQALVRGHEALDALLGEHPGLEASPGFGRRVLDLVDRESAGRAVWWPGPPRPACFWP
jgi:anti-sigma factor RsiW